MAMGQGAFDLEGLVEGADRLSAQHCPHGVDRGGWQLGEVGQGAVLDLAALAVGLANQHRAVLPASLPAGHSGYMHRTRGAPWHIRIVAVPSPNVKSINGYIGRAASTRIKINSPQELRARASPVGCLLGQVCGSVHERRPARALFGTPLG